MLFMVNDVEPARRTPRKESTFSIQPPGRDLGESGGPVVEFDEAVSGLAQLGPRTTLDRPQ
jgi:hypothetical protein